MSTVDLCNFQASQNHYAFPKSEVISCALPWGEEWVSLHMFRRITHLYILHLYTSYTFSDESRSDGDLVPCSSLFPPLHHHLNYFPGILQRGPIVPHIND